MVLIVSWDKIALKQLEEACNFIRKDSLKNAQNVRKTVLNLAKRLAVNPEKYPLGKYKLRNDGAYRAFEKYHLRVVYYVTDTEIKIISVRHTKMEPRNY